QLARDSPSVSQHSSTSGVCCDTELRWGVASAVRLPDMRVDVMTFPRPLQEMGEVSRDIAAAGFDGVLFTEGGRTAYLSAGITAVEAPGLHISTGVAVAFPRSPMVTAQVAWELQQATAGNFRLGLGTQVRAHVVRRYSAEF